MTISKIYTCDICGSEIKQDIHCNNKAARIKFTTDYDCRKNLMKLCYLQDNSASEKIICRKCIEGIKEAKWDV